jgi:ribosome recycling factor
MFMHSTNNFSPHSAHVPTDYNLATRVRPQKGEGNDNSADETESVLLALKCAHITTTFLTPGSQQAFTKPTARCEFALADAKMVACVEWLRCEVAQLDAHASGRVTPQLLAPVRVSVAASGEKKARWEEVATFGVRDGSFFGRDRFRSACCLLCCAPF